MTNKDINYEFMKIVGKHSTHWNYSKQETIKRLTALISQLENEVRIDELHNLAKKQKTFVGYGYDDIGVDINDIDDRIATLQAKEQE